MIRDYIVYGLYKAALNLVGGTMMALIIGFEPILLAKIYIALTMNVFGIPIIILTDVFQFPMWVWYIIVLEWIGVISMVHRMES